MTTTQICDSVAERVALGQALGELAEHAEGCARCRRTVDMPAALTGTHRDVDPGLGFTARMTIGARHRLGVRRRRRIAAGLAATVAAGVIGVIAVTRSPEAPSHAVATDTRPAPTDPTPDPTPDPAAVDDDLAALVRLADTDRSSRLSARWRDIERPLSPYRKMLRGVTP